MVIYRHHPSGPTSCGKTYFVKTLLQNCQIKISPPPQRILWLYKRWQPLYDVIKGTVFPRVEFIQGIPLDLEQDSFIHSSTRNIVILDDLMSMASKDPRINELFTEGSHHRNLSVIAINQNLYYNKDPTQRRNCHYLMMFNNPVDKQQVMTLARQMYPENPQYLMRHFKDAVNKPYGYLLTDLKPATPDSLRMRTAVFQEQPIKAPHPIKASQTTTDNHFKGDTAIDQTWSQQQQTVHSKRQDEQEVQLFTTGDKPQQQQEEIFEMPSCDDCGLLFEDIHDLQRHIKTWCPENKSHKKKRKDEVPYKKSKLISYESEGDKEEEMNEEHKVFDKLMKMASRESEDQWRQKVEKYKKEGLTEKEATTKADKKNTRR